MSTGATPEQIEAAARRWLDNVNHPQMIGAAHAHKRAELWSRYLVPPDHRIIRADENHLTPELRSALGRMVQTLNDAMGNPDGWRDTLSASDWFMIEAAIAEAER